MIYKHKLVNTQKQKNLNIQYACSKFGNSAKMARYHIVIGLYDNIKNYAQCNIKWLYRIIVLEVAEIGRNRSQVA